MNSILLNYEFFFRFLKPVSFFFPRAPVFILIHSRTPSATCFVFHDLVTFEAISQCLSPACGTCCIQIAPPGGIWKCGVSWGMPICRCLGIEPVERRDNQRSAELRRATHQEEFPPQNVNGTLTDTQRSQSLSSK